MDSPSSIRPAGVDSTKQLQEQHRRRALRLIEAAVTTSEARLPQPADLSARIESLSLVDDLRFDSVQLLALLMQIEDTFDVGLDDLDPNALMSVGALVQHVVCQLAAPGVPVARCATPRTR